MAVGITNQRETTLVWDRNTGRPLHNAIVWLDTRTAALCERLTKQLGSQARTPRPPLWRRRPGSLQSKA